MKTIMIIILIALLSILGFIIIRQGSIIDEAKSESKFLQTQLDSIFIDLSILQNKADSTKQLTDSLNSELSIHKEKSSKIIINLEREADSLSTTIVSLIPPGEVRDSVRKVIEQLNETHMAQMKEMRDLLTLSDATISSIRAELNLQYKINSELTSALATTTTEKNLWKKTALKISDNNIIGKIKSNYRIIGTAISVGFIMGSLAGG